LSKSRFAAAAWHFDTSDMIVKPEAGTADFSTLQEAPCFTPTHDEFKDPLKYIASIRRDAEPYGICKIRPPKGWKPPFAQHQDVLKFQTKKQDLRTLEGRGRLRLRFEEALRKFMFAIGKPMPSVLKGMSAIAAISANSCLP
jgi:jmjN domain